MINSLKMIKKHLKKISIMKLVVVQNYPHISNYGNKQTNNNSNKQAINICVSACLCVCVRIYTSFCVRSGTSNLIKLLQINTFTASITTKVYVPQYLPQDVNNVTRHLAFFFLSFSFLRNHLI